MSHLRVTRRAAGNLRAGHLWVYRSELEDAAAAQSLAPGDLVTVEDGMGRPLGSALSSSTSQIALRLVSRVPELTRAQYLDDVRARILVALQRRRQIAPLDAEPGRETTAQRLIFSEADDLPGIVADRYGETIVLQLLIQGTAQKDVREIVAETLAEQVGAETLTIWERPDPRIRQLEALPPSPEQPLLHRGNGDPKTAGHFFLNGLRFGFDAGAGQKTGAFLDQRLNYRAAADAVRRSGMHGEALDVCTYHGGFALHLADVCKRVTGVDQSRSALVAAESNLQLNPSLRAEVQWIEADAFQLLRALEGAETSAAARSNTGLPARFDAIVLDPPAFAKSRRAAEDALRGYKELNLRAMRLLNVGGTLVTCSCSHHVSLEAFTTTVSAAAADANRRVQLLQTYAAAPDHPEVLTLPETLYLKCLICRVE